MSRKYVDVFKEDFHLLSQLSYTEKVYLNLFRTSLEKSLKIAVILLRSMKISHYIFPSSL